MKTLLSALLALCFTALGLAQETAPIGMPKRTPEELQKLLAPIALYPDSLVALILPASTVSADVVLAARYLGGGGDPKEVDTQAWDPSVRSLAHYPGVVKWMDENLEWTRELGEAFVAQPAEVMTSIQKIRAEAQQKGLLSDTAQQKVIVREGEICILPANPEVIYVPYYDPELIFLSRPRPDVWLTFSVGFPIGSWLYYDCDWGRRSVWMYRRPIGWVYRPDWRWHEPHRPIHTYCDPWRPNERFWHYARLRANGPYHRPIPHVRPARQVVDVPPSQWRDHDRHRDWAHDRTPGRWTREPDSPRHDGGPGRSDGRREDRRGDRPNRFPGHTPYVHTSPPPATGGTITPAPAREPDTRSAARWREVRERNAPPAAAYQPRVQHSTPSAPRYVPPQPARVERIGSVTPRSYSPPPPRVQAPAPRVEHHAPVSAPRSSPAPAPAARNGDDRSSNGGAASSAARAWRSH